MSKIETTIKVSLKLPRRINLGRQGARAELSTWTMPISPPLPTAPKGPKAILNTTASWQIPRPTHNHKKRKDGTETRAIRRAYDEKSAIPETIPL